jgi:hypothetical protein
MGRRVTYTSETTIEDPDNPGDPIVLKLSPKGHCLVIKDRDGNEIAADYDDILLIYQEGIAMLQAAEEARKAMANSQAEKMP